MLLISALAIGASALQLTYRFYSSGYHPSEALPSAVSQSFFQADPGQLTKYGAEMAELMGIGLWAQDRNEVGSREATKWISSSFNRSFQTGRNFMQGYHMPTQERPAPQKIKGRSWLDGAYQCRLNEQVLGTQYSSEHSKDILGKFQQFIGDHITIYSLPDIYHVYSLLMTQHHELPKLEWYELHELQKAQITKIKAVVRSQAGVANHLLFEQILNDIRTPPPQQIVFAFTGERTLYNIISVFTDLDKHLSENSLLGPYAHVEIKLSEEGVKVKAQGLQIASMQLLQFVEKLQNQMKHNLGVAERCPRL